MIDWLHRLFRKEHKLRAIRFLQPRQCPCVQYGDLIDHCKSCDDTGIVY